MPYDTKVLKQKAIEAIKKNKLIFIEDVCAMIGIAKSTYYDHFKEGSDDSNELNTILNENKISLKVSLRKKWFDSDNATLQMALYKLCSTRRKFLHNWSSKYNHISSLVKRMELRNTNKHKCSDIYRRHNIYPSSKYT